MGAFRQKRNAVLRWLVDSRPCDGCMGGHKTLMSKRVKLIIKTTVKMYEYIKTTITTCIHVEIHFMGGKTSRMYKNI